MGKWLYWQRQQLTVIQDNTDQLFDKSDKQDSIITLRYILIWENANYELVSQSVSQSIVKIIYLFFYYFILNSMNICAAATTVTAAAINMLW